MTFCKASFGSRQMSCFDGRAFHLSAGELLQDQRFVSPLPNSILESIRDLAIGGR
jgi:hypothetical protein